MEKSAIKAKSEFETIGLTKLLTEEEREEVLSLQTKIKSIENKISQLKSGVNIENTISGHSFATGNYTRPKYIIDFDYTLGQQGAIFNLLKRKNIKIEFLNSSNKNCYIKEVDYRKEVIDKYNSALLTVAISGASDAHMKLNTWLNLYAKGDFHDIRPYAFVNAYLRPYTKSKKYKEQFGKYEDELAKLNSEYKALQIKYKEYENRYNSEKAKINKDYQLIQNEYTRLEKEAKAKNITREVNKGTLKIKSIWNSIISPEEQATFMGWLAKHVYSMRLYVLKGGASEASMDRPDAYPDDSFGPKRRTEPQYKEGKLISNDAVNGYIQLDNIKGAPEKAILSLSRKTELTSPNWVSNNRLDDLNLMLFVLAEYNKYGFKVGTSKLKNQINADALRDEMFSDYKDAFNLGYNS